MTVFAPRACAILHDLLQGDDRPFLIPANICSVVPETFQKAGRAFELIDIEEETLEIDPEACLDRLPAGGLL
ncbi:MAG TPA: hypothetical protein VFR31_01820, partial [Thermoanaerobaculia bacterium]|nr:hypothetical protein [Thermoanaerobaculia bacterium]